MAKNRVANRILKARNLGKKIRSALSRFKSQAENVSGGIVKVLHEMEGKMLRATGVVKRGKGSGKGSTKTGATRQK